MIDNYTNHKFFNDEVNKYLESIIKTKLFSNGYIFYGAEGLGKKQAALQFIETILKKYPLNKQNEEKITYVNHPDF